MNGHLATYLNDHLAGAVAGTEIAKHLEEHAAAAEIRTTMARVRRDIDEDEAELRSLADRLGIEQSSIRKAGAWIAEKFAELKLTIDDEANGEFRTYEALEALSLGIEGKRCLWLTLQSVKDPDLIDLDLKRLQTRAEDQRKRVEELRLQAANLAFSK